ncbi:CBS domain-containing protein [Turneriella parva]|uniref:Signal transduction protein with CBS domains n=1 Tax=Turneriella parva (strain ATCC BAA-1111 / DSM 21527 / NCTC 11395 / H) TaxID=869212 RepID=I4B2A3_TURPD|nr:CBS domain-containing protein [Turneriella parva]AFM11410.1 putative signal transduction protein with CBS domains [Turneriella parva DSM 21527]
MRYSDTLTVGELMHRNVVTARAGDNVEATYTAMIAGRFRHMPVVDAKGKLLGILSDRDLRNVLVFINEADGKKSVVGDRQLTVEKVMTRDPMTVESEDSVRTVVKIMVKHKVGCLPVCDAAGVLQGLVTETDLLRLLEELLTTGAK